MFSLFIGILKPGSIKIERGMKKYFRGLIMRFVGLMGGSLVPSEGPSYVKVEGLGPFKIFEPRAPANMRESMQGGCK